MSIDLKAAIFDFDGTLADSIWVWLDVDRVFLEKRGLVCDDDYLMAVRNSSFTEAAVYTVERFGLNEDPADIVAEWFEMAAARYRDDVMLRAGAKDYLAGLRSAGIPLALATSSTPELCFSTMERCGILDWFDIKITAQEVKVSKKQPDAFLLAAKGLGVEPQSSVVFEDIHVAIATASQAGFRTVGVYEPSHAADWEGILRDADWTIRAYDEVDRLPIFNQR